MTLKTRFAPSPSGLLHLGNARTALFNHLLARASGGGLLLRIEDTDAERSEERYIQALVCDLRWLGLHWNEGEGAGDDDGDSRCRQSDRGDIYASHYQRLQQQDLAYPCFCSADELARVRRSQQRAGQPPRYSGACARLSVDEVEQHRHQSEQDGEAPTLRFRVPVGAEVRFTDLVRGEQLFKTRDIGDFIIRRGDGSAAFFFSNAVDDALMGVTHVLRGEDHLTNTPRQLLLLEALALTAPAYGHISLIVGDDGKPLSKRHGSRSLADLREAGYRPEAVVNYLARLGHRYQDEGLLDDEALASGFALSALGRAPARHDPAQLLRRQREALERCTPEQAWDWMAAAVQQRVPAEQRQAFVEAILPNISFPHEAADWAELLYGALPTPEAEVAAVISGAGGEFFNAALAAVSDGPIEFKALSSAVKAATGAKGKQLFQPLRASLTGRLHGPEMGRLVALIPAQSLIDRLRAAATASQTP